MNNKANRNNDHTPPMTPGTDPTLLTNGAAVSSLHANVNASLHANANAAIVQGSQNTDSTLVFKPGSPSSNEHAGPKDAAATSVGSTGEVEVSELGIVNQGAQSANRVIGYEKEGHERNNESGNSGAGHVQPVTPGTSDTLAPHGAFMTIDNPNSSAPDHANEHSAVAQGAQYGSDASAYFSPGSPSNDDRPDKIKTDKVNNGKGSGKIKKDEGGWSGTGDTDGKDLASMPIMTPSVEKISGNSTNPLG